MNESAIQDSGERIEFETGAKRDIQRGKGRCDLMPLDVLAVFFTTNSERNKVLENLEFFKSTGDEAFLIRSLDAFNEETYLNNKTMMLDVSVHYEEGSEKYGENNWQKGIPTHSYIDSAVRHYLKLIRGDKDERHDRAFVWNVLCCIWTVKNKPEMQDYPNITEENK